MKKKALLVMLCAALLVVSAVLGTLAYFTDTDNATNTFTVGKVGIELDEAEVNPDGTLKSEDRVKENKYHLLPGMKYIKDPTIKVDADSEDCYLFVKVENGIKNIEGDKTVAAQMDELGWKSVDGIQNVYVYAKEAQLDKCAVSKGTNVKVFETFTIDGDNVTNAVLESYENASIVVTAYAVQKAGFEDSSPKQIWETALASF